jgi:pimeloyl-ACP methyl ester carboxylesterase
VDEMMKYIKSQHFDNLALAYQQKYQPSTSPQQLARVRIPVLIVRGTEDKDNGSETELQKMIPKSKLAYVPGNHNTASHSPEFSKAILDFLGER